MMTNEFRQHGHSEGAPMIYVLLAENFNLMRSVTEAYLESEKDIQVIGAWSKLTEIEQALWQIVPDVLVISDDLFLGGLQAITRNARSISILVTSMHGDPRLLATVLRCGAHGLILKTNFEAQLIPAVRTLARGELYFDVPYIPNGKLVTNLPGQGYP